MDCSAKALIDLATCTDSCVPAGAMQSIEIALACSWVNAGGAPPCTLPSPPIDLGASSGNGQVTLTWPAGVGATGYNIKRALVPGGPYTVIGTSSASPYVDLMAVNGTTYYYVVSSTNACGESAGNSIESHATPVSGAPILSNGAGGFCQLVVDITGNVGAQASAGPATVPAPVLADGSGGFWQLVTDAICDRGTTSVAGPATAPVVLIDANNVHWTLIVDALGNIGAVGPFSYVPATAIITWTDINGAGQNGNLAFFNATADIASVSQVSIASQGLTSISNPAALPSLTFLALQNNALTVLDLTGCLSITTLVCATNLLTALDVTHNPALTYLDCNNNSLTALDVTHNTALAYLNCAYNALGSLNLTANTALTYLNAEGCGLMTVNISQNILLNHLDVLSNPLTTINISANPLLTVVYVFICNLTVLAVNTILSQLVTFGLAGGVVNISTQTPAAPPSVGPPNGIAAKAALVAAAWTVTTD